MAAEDEERPGRAPHIIWLPSYRTEPDESTAFRPSAVREICKSVLEETLKTQKYDEENTREWSLEISESIKSRVKSLNMPRYKIVVQVTIGEKKHQGATVASRCLWNAATDNYASVSYENQSLWASAIVFGAYTD